MSGAVQLLSPHITPLLFQGPSIFRDTCFFFHEISHQLPHPILCSPKVPTLVTEMEQLFSNFQHLVISQGCVSSTPFTTLPNRTQGTTALKATGSRSLILARDRPGPRIKGKTDWCYERSYGPRTGPVCVVNPSDQQPAHWSMELPTKGARLEP